MDTSVGSEQQFGPANTRCLNYGFKCDVVKRMDAELGQEIEVHENCQPRTDWLKNTRDYAKGFQGLKDDPHRVLVSTIAGPNTTPLVGQSPNSDLGPEVLASCGAPFSGAAPALRLHAFTEAFEENGTFHSVCSDDFGPALTTLGDRIRARIGGKCIVRPPLTQTGGLACRAGDVIGKPAAGVTCATSCLASASCRVFEKIMDRPNTELPACPAGLPEEFDTLNTTLTATCWRLVHKDICGVGGSPYALDVIRPTGARPMDAGDTGYLVIECDVAPYPWESDRVVDVPQC